MENPSNREENWQVLSKEMVTSYSTETLLIERALDKPKRFSPEDLKKFTNDFDTNIGSGGFGVVYKGEFPSGVQVAVKVMAEQNVTEELFMSEVRIMGMTNHQNLVKLYGFCYDSNMKGLVYEYMENGSLDKILYKKDTCIEWDMLYNIMIKTAEAISYLHDSCQERIIHHDLKAANVLLDSNFSPKVADFGLAKLMSKDVTHVTMSRPVGTRGFMAPEMWMPFSQVTYKCDVYSFSMLLFEVLGMRSTIQNDEWLPKKVWKEVEKRQLHKIIEDCGIKGKDRENAKILSMVAFWCAQFTPERRPSMSTVVKMLKKEIQVSMPPNPFLASSSVTTETSSEGHEDKVSKKELEDKILAQQENKDLKAIKPQSSSPEENIIVLVNYAMQDNGFSHGKPITAIVIYKCLLHWNSFESEKTSIFDRLIQMIDSTINNSQEDKARMDYWLSNISMLLFFLECSFRGTRATQPGKNAYPGTSIFRKMTRGFRSAPHVVNIDMGPGNIVLQVEAKNPALHFKQQLTTYVEKFLAIIGEQLKKDLRSFIHLCIHEPRISRLSGKSDTSSDNHWQSIIDILNTFLVTMESNFVPSLLIRIIFSQIFYYLNTQIFNSLLLRQECCSLSYGWHVKEGLDELEWWCRAAKDEHAGSSWDELKHIRQAIGLLVISDKPQITMEQITQVLCPDLNIRQLYQICRTYSDDENDTPGVSNGLISQMRNYGNNSFLIEGISNVLFSIDGLSNSLGKVDLSNITLDVELLKYPAFQFLKA